MKRLLLVAVALMAGAAALATASWSPAPSASDDCRSIARDDPPPEPVDCPLCAGNAQTHVRRLFAIHGEAGRRVALLLSL